MMCFIRHICTTAAIALLLLATHSHAAVFGLDLGKDSAEFTAFGGDVYETNFDMGMSIFYNTNTKDTLLSWDLKSPLEGDSSSPWIFSLSMRLFASSHYIEPNQSVATGSETIYGFGAMLGGNFGYRFLTSIPITTFLKIDYSPHQINGGKVEELLQLQLVNEFLLTPSAIGVIGLRDYSVVFSDGKLHHGDSSKQLEKGLFIGVKIRV